MAPLLRIIRSGAVAGVPALGAVLEQGRAAVAFGAPVTDATLSDLADAEAVSSETFRAGALRLLPADAVPFAAPSETGLFAGRDVLVAVRNGERPEAVGDWLDWHIREIGAQGAVILDRAPPEETGFFEGVSALALPEVPVLVVQCERPLGRAGLPDARDIDNVLPGRWGPVKRGVADPWHSGFGAPAVFEVLRRRFLAEARAVAVLDIADLVLEEAGDGGPFARALAAPGQYVPMLGAAAFPWRLRRSAPAPHGDHIAVRIDDRLWVSSWAAAVADMPEGCLWQPVRPLGAPAAPIAPVRFRRAMGVVFPGVPVNRLVEKTHLIEDGDLLRALTERGGARPIRLPAPAVLPDVDRAARQVTVVTAMKNEGAFILDWIAHNRAIGIERHLVYTNDCDDSTDRLLDALSDAGVTRRDNPFRTTGGVPQHAAFRAALAERVVCSADWLMTLDVDEFINIHAGAGRLDDLFDTVPEAHAISMPWRLFGNGDRHAYEDRPVTEQFTRCAPEYSPRPLQAWAFKTLYRNAGLFRRLGVHRPKGMAPGIAGRLNWVDGSGRALPPKVRHAAWRMSTRTWGYDLVTLNHYAVRSAESFLVKRERGRVNHVDRAQGEAYWLRMNLNADEDRSILRLARRVAEEKARLLTLPGVADAHDEAVAWHRARIALLKSTGDGAAFLAEITSPRMEKLCRMQHRFGSAVFLAGPRAVPDEIVARDPGEDFFFTVEDRG